MLLRHQAGDAGPGSGHPAGDSKGPGSDGGAGSKTPTGQDNEGQGGNLSLEERYAALEKRFTETEAAHAKLKTEVGKNADRAGKYDQLIKSMTKDPQAFLSEFAKNSGIELPAAKPKLTGTLTDFQSEGGLEKLADALNKSATDAATRQLSPVVNKVMEAHFAQVFPDYNDLSEDRTGIEAAVATGQLTKTEVLHFAARGMKRDEALKEHGDKRYAEGMEAAYEEMRAAMNDAGATEKAGAKKRDPKTYLKDVVLKRAGELNASQ